MYERVDFDKLKGENEHQYTSPTFALNAKFELVLKNLASGE